MRSVRAAPAAAAAPFPPHPLSYLAHQGLNLASPAFSPAGAAAAAYGRVGGSSGKGGGGNGGGGGGGGGGRFGGSAAAAAVDISEGPSRGLAHIDIGLPHLGSSHDFLQASQQASGERDMGSQLDDLLAFGTQQSGYGSQVGEGRASLCEV